MFIQLPRFLFLAFNILTDRLMYHDPTLHAHQKFFLMMLKKLLSPSHHIQKLGEDSHVLTEDDLIALFRQFPFEEFINSIFGDVRMPNWVASNFT